MITFPEDPRLPEIDKSFDINSYHARLHRRLRELCRTIYQCTSRLVSPPMCRVDLNGTDQALASGTEILLNLTAVSANSIDTEGLWDATNHRYAPRELGVYRVGLTVQLEYSGGLSNAGILVVSVRKNGVAELETVLNTDDATAVDRTFEVTGLVSLDTLGDYLDFTITSTAGTLLKAIGLTRRTYACIEFRGRR